MDTSNRAPATWTTPQCPFTIEYSTRVLDDIRLAVTDAFFSLPRGGVEIGGILLGHHLPGRVIIEGYQALDCEHAFGPSFTLSPNDITQLEIMLENTRSRHDIEPVGWYHSHTRSDIFLSPADIEIHRRYFSEPWLVALVLRPRTMGPTGAGFFFNERDGSIHAESSYAEFALDSLPVRPVPIAPPAPAAAPPMPEPPRNGSVIDIAPAIESRARPPAPIDISAVRPLASAPEPDDPPAPIEFPRPKVIELQSPEPPSPEVEAPLEFPTPSFAVEAPPSRGWKTAVAIAVGLALGAASYQTRDRWMPQLRALTAKAHWAAPSRPSNETPQPQLTVSPDATVNFSAIDSEGQLQLRWDRNSLLVRGSTGALLMITDGGAPPQAIGLDAAHLQAGSFTYARQSGHVDVVFTIHLPNGQDLKEIATFLGQTPGQRPVDDPRQKELADQNTKLQKQAARTKKLEQTVEDMRSELQKEQQRRRLENQAPDVVKK